MNIIMNKTEMPIKISKLQFYYLILWAVIGIAFIFSGVLDLMYYKGASVVSISLAGVWIVYTIIHLIFTSFDIGK